MEQTINISVEEALHQRNYVKVNCSCYNLSHLIVVYYVPIEPHIQPHSEIGRKEKRRNCKREQDPTLPEVFGHCHDIVVQECVFQAQLLRYYLIIVEHLFTSSLSHFSADSQKE